MNESTPCFEIQLPALWKFHFKKGAISVKCLASASKVARGQFQSVPSRATRTESYLLTQEDGIKVLVFVGAKPSCAKDFTHVISTDTVTIGTDLVTLGNDTKWVIHPERLTDPASVDSSTRDEATKSWTNGINYIREASISATEKKDGLRSPQLGALHAIASHWTLTHTPGIIVMPTGTGKTEVMLAATVAEACPCLLVIVPSDALRTQTADKFADFGILKKFGIVSESAHYPVVARLSGTPKSADDLSIVDNVNVIVSTMQALASASNVVLESLASKCTHLFFDEAHHTPADSWSRLKTVFKNKKILQFTATPFRRDGKRLEGKILFNYLQYFLTPEISQVFCPTENTFDFSDIDRGKIICVAMPQKFQAERRYVCTFLKMLYYTHVLRRFDKSKDERKDDNLLILWADEAQRFVTASEDGMSDYNCVDVIREARATIVAAAQSSSSFIPPLGREKARVLSLNLRNRMIFRAADEEGANDSADFLGKKKVIKKSWGYSGGRQSSNFSEMEEHRIKPHILRGMPKHTAVLVHCDRGIKRTLLPPLEPDGKVSSWFRRKLF